MLRCAICEDEPEMAERLAVLLKESLAAAGQPAAIDRFAQGQALLTRGREYDLVLLDIRLDGGGPGAGIAATGDSGIASDAPAPPNTPTPPGAFAAADAPVPPNTPPPDNLLPAAPPLDGMQTARLLRRQGSRCLLIFVTALCEPVYDAFAVEAFDYLTKPVDPARFAATVARALRALAARGRQSLILPRAGGREVIPLEQLVYCEVQGRRLYLHRLDGSVLDCPGRMKDLERQLDGRFFKCHRSYLVNLDHLQGFGGGLARLPGGGQIPVSRLREQELAAALLRRMRQREGTR